MWLALYFTCIPKVLSSIKEMRAMEKIVPEMVEIGESDEPVKA